MTCKAITGSWKSTPTAAMEAMLNLTPLLVFIETESINTISRLSRQQGNSLRETDHLV